MSKEEEPGYIKGYQQAIRDVLVLLDGKVKTYGDAKMHDRAIVVDIAMSDIRETAKYDPCDDFTCGYCGVAVNGYFLYCSQDCTDKAEAEMTDGA